jgi:hypothetical protein
MISIANLQEGAGLTASCHETLVTAQQLASGLPLPPTMRAPRSADTPTPYDQIRAYQDLLLAAIKSHDLGFARSLTQRWRPVSSPDLIVDAWLDAGQVAEATSFAHELNAPQERAKMLLSIAQFMLDKAGAPNI